MTIVFAPSLEELQQENYRLLALIEQQKTFIETLKHQLDLFRHARFGRKSEKGSVPEQLCIQFDETVPVVEPEVQEEANTETAKKEGLAHRIVAIIGKLYQIECELKEKNATPAQIFITRIRHAKPILCQLKALFDDSPPKVPPQSPIAQALTYALTHWNSLNNYLYDGRLEIDNNRAERAIKPFVIGRKNWLFHGNDIGANAGSILFSLIETCKQHQIDVFSWLKYVLANIHQAQTIEGLEKLLPYNIDKILLTDMRSIPALISPAKEAVE